MRCCPAVLSNAVVVRCQLSQLVPPVLQDVAQCLLRVKSPLSVPASTHHVPCFSRRTGAGATGMMQQQNEESIQHGCWWRVVIRGLATAKSEKCIHNSYLGGGVLSVSHRRVTGSHEVFAEAPLVYSL